MHQFLLALIAAVAMVITDVLGVILVTAEARNHGWLAGYTDGAQWVVGITTTSISVTILQGHSFAGKTLIIVLVTVANIVGTRLGSYVSKRFVPDTLESRITALEEALKKLTAK